MASSTGSLSCFSSSSSSSSRSSSFNITDFLVSDQMNIVKQNNNNTIEIPPKFNYFPPISTSPFSPSSFLASTPTFSPSLLLDSPLPFPGSDNMNGSLFTGGNASNKEDGKYSSFSFQSQTRPSVASSSSAAQPSQYHNNSFSSSEQMYVRQGVWTSTASNQKTEAVAAKEGVGLGQPNAQSSYSLQQQQPSSQAHYTSQPTQYVREQKSEDGYNWRKYGQKQVKGSENPRSYYKCTYLNCPTKKKVERNSDGHITEIVYKGSHNHPKPQSTRRNSSQSYQNSSFVSSEMLDNSQMESAVTPENSSASFGDDDFDQAGSTMNRSRDNENGDEPEAKKWKGESENEALSAASGSTTVREPRIVVQTTSDIDILDDGFRWRKYGQKVVKGNPNPRSYYKCTHNGCPVRKHIERASHDLRAVITTYEGKHNHDVPAARGSGRYNENRLPPSATSNSSVVPSAIRPLAVAYSSYQGTTGSLNSLQGMRLPTTQSNRAPFELQMLQNSDSLRFSGYGNSGNSDKNPSQLMANAISTAKEEPKDDSFFDYFLN